MQLNKKNRQIDIARRCLAKILAVTLAAGGALMMVSPLAAAEWPTRPIRVVVPFPPGGTTDIIGRMVSEKLQVALGVPVVVENRPGANGSPGAAVVAQAAPDGYTLLIGTPGPTVINDYLYDNVPYKPRTAFTPIITLATLPNVLMIGPRLKVSSVSEFIQTLKAAPDRYTNASPGVGSSGHISTELFKARAGLKSLHVPYKGSLPMLTDLAGGQTDYTVDQITSAFSLIQAGKLKPLAVTSPDRSPLLPDVPTLMEAGFSDIKILVWFSLQGPAGLPPAIVERLNHEVNAILRDPAIQERLRQYGATAAGGTPEDLKALMKQEEENFLTVVKTVNLKDSN